MEFRLDPELSVSGAPPLHYYLLSLLVDGSPGQLKDGSDTENAIYTFISASQRNGLYTLQDLF